ncbi:MAG: serine/threonine-protein kinase, partial [Polyangiaceae bacterium]
MVTPHVRLTEPLGEGAMGAVWVAEHLTLHTDVAVKFISEQLARDNPEIVARFEREASVAAQIKSPYVVQTFDHGVTDDGTPYIVMELLEGESLEERIQRSGPLPLEETSQIISQVARALRRAHEKGIVHRDIKPDNIFVTLQDDGVFCKILDFGIAKQAQLPQMGRLTNAGIMIGTPEYMSPEQVLSSKDVDFHTDLWALAVTAYEALTARLPFEAEALGELCVKLLNGEFLPPSHYRSELPSTVDDWFRIALNRDLAQRLDGARELSTTFMHALDLTPNSILQHTLTGSRRIETITGLTPAVSQPGSRRIETITGLAPAVSQPGAMGPASSQPGAMEPASSQPGAPDAAIPGKSPTLSGTFASINADRIPAWRQPKWLAAAAAVLAVAGLGAMLLATSNQPRPSSPAATISDSASSE